MKLCISAAAYEKHQAVMRAIVLSCKIVVYIIKNDNHDKYLMFYVHVHYKYIICWSSFYVQESHYVN